jgi:hypothetical protein
VWGKKKKVAVKNLQYIPTNTKRPPEDIFSPSMLSIIFHLPPARGVLKPQWSLWIVQSAGSVLEWPRSVLFAVFRAAVSLRSANSPRLGPRRGSRGTIQTQCYELHRNVMSESLRNLHECHAAVECGRGVWRWSRVVLGRPRSFGV